MLFYKWVPMRVADSNEVGRLSSLSLLHKVSFVIFTCLSSFSIFGFLCRIMHTAPKPCWIWICLHIHCLCSMSSNFRLCLLLTFAVVHLLVQCIIKETLFQGNGTTEAVRMGETAMSGITATTTKGTRKSTSTEGQEPESQYRTVTVGEWRDLFYEQNIPKAKQRNLKLMFWVLNICVLLQEWDESLSFVSFKYSAYLSDIFFLCVSVLV